MRNINRLILLTIFFNFLIIVGAGHGFGLLGLFEILSLRDYLNGKVTFNPVGTYYDKLFVSATIAAVGQIILIFAYFTKSINKKCLAVYLGLFILFASFSNLVVDFTNFAYSSLAFWAGSPFLISGILLLLMTIKINKSK